MNRQEYFDNIADQLFELAYNDHKKRVKNRAKNKQARKQRKINRSRK